MHITSTEDESNNELQHNIWIFPEVIHLQEMLSIKIEALDALHNSLNDLRDSGELSQTLYLQIVKRKIESKLEIEL